MIAYLISRHVILLEEEAYMQDLNIYKVIFDVYPSESRVVPLCYFNVPSISKYK